MDERTIEALASGEPDPLEEPTRRNTYRFRAGQRVRWDEPNKTVWKFQMDDVRERHGDGPFTVDVVLEAYSAGVGHSQSVRIGDDWFSGAFFQPVK